MEIKEALKLLDELNIMTLYDGDSICDSEFAKALRMAISALEKQEPKKAVGTHYAHMRCPACNHRIPSGGGSSSHRRDNWCNYCGQKIDWSE